MLSYEDPGNAADWLVEAFGFTEVDRFTDSSGRATHVNLEYGGSIVMAGTAAIPINNLRRSGDNRPLFASSDMSTPLLFEDTRLVP